VQALHRADASRSILDDIKAYLEAEKPKVLPKSPVGEAIDYTLSNWRALERYCEDGDLEIDNNGARAEPETDCGGAVVTGMFYGSDPVPACR
jgi:hypothetical protein